MISREIMGPLMFGGLIVFMLIGYPVAFSLAAVGLFFGFVGVELGYFELSLLQALPERVFGILSNDLLLRFSRLVDALNEAIGRVASWLVLVACLISAGNALMRYAFNASSNAWLEIQW